ncbi:MAG: spoIVB [Clostridiales bacterium]|nr:spoIVB [Clostridiales bacterium]
MKNNAFKIFISFFITLMFIFLAATVKVMSMPGDIKLSEGKKNLNSLESSNLKSNFIYKLNMPNEEEEQEYSNQNTLDVNVKLFGVFPVKTVTLNFMPEIKVIPGGQPIGVKLYTEGVLVVGFADVDTVSGKKQSPAVISGVEMGDSIIEINGMKINNNSHVSEIINKNRSGILNVKLNRKGDIKSVSIKPIEAKTKDEYKIGLWIRDFTAGVGTLTFYDPVSGKFGALGHPINDVDTGSLLSVKNGKIYNARILSIEQGVKGKPGELRGIFSEEDEAGFLKKNTSSGIYGETTNLNGLTSREYNHKPIPIARQNEVKEGAAKILTSIDDGNVKAYDIYIEKLTQQSKPNSKGMIIRITDKELLEKTGGIVQGMSGSPIIQDGKIIGAVTHVFVNRPDMGYGIYIEWMLQEIGMNI